MFKKYEDFKKYNEGMKKFSNISKTKKERKKVKKTESEESGDGDQTNIKDTKEYSDIIDDNIIPNDNSVFNDKKHKPSNGIVNLDENVHLVGKVAKFPKNTKASKAYNFLENVKISKNKIWYILVEKQQNELQMVKYSTKKGVNLSEFINELKSFYITKYGKNEKLISLLSNIELSGDDKGNFSSIRNIPNITVGGIKLIRKITEDLTSLLSGKLDNKK